MSGMTYATVRRFRPLRSARSATRNRGPNRCASRQESRAASVAVRLRMAGLPPGLRRRRDLRAVQHRTRRRRNGRTRQPGRRRQRDRRPRQIRRRRRRDHRARQRRNGRRRYGRAVQRDTRRRRYLGARQLRRGRRRNRRTRQRDTRRRRNRRTHQHDTRRRRHDRNRTHQLLGLTRGHRPVPSRLHTPNAASCSPCKQGQPPRPSLPHQYATPVTFAGRIRVHGWIRRTGIHQILPETRIHPDNPGPDRASITLTCRPRAPRST